MTILPELEDIKKERVKLNITQADLERELGIPQATISRIENGVGNPSYLIVKKIFTFLDNQRTNMERSERTAENIMTRGIISISSNVTIKEAVNLMNENVVSQVPIIDNGQNIGSLTAKRIQKHIADNPDLINIRVSEVKELPFPEIEKGWSLKDISNLLLNYSAVLVKEYDKFVGIITDADFFKVT